MRALSGALISESDVVRAIEEESVYDRGWITPEPWWTSLLNNKAKIARHIFRRLQRGAAYPQAQIVNARKQKHGVRPIAIMTSEARIVYRTLASSVVPQLNRPQRSARAYADFVLRPIVEAYPRTGFQPISASTFKYILNTDIAAYYDYIDHGTLRSEFDLLGAPIDSVDATIDLLGELSGRSYGIPQRSEPSDWLADAYAKRVERSVKRDGFTVWRYADDFKVGCRSYAEAVSAIESLARACRDAGLILNEMKTSTPKFLTYLFDNSSLDVLNTTAQLDPSDVEAAVTTDYLPDDDDQEVDDAREVFARLVDPAVKSPPSDLIFIHEMDGDQHRTVRRALNSLLKHADPSGLRHILSLLAYQPAMTHRAISYVVEVVDADRALVIDTMEKAATRLSLNCWQRAWLAYGMRECGVDLAQSPDCLGWLRNRYYQEPLSYAAAEAALTLASAGLIAQTELVDRASYAPDDFKPWYMLAIKAASGKPAPKGAIESLRQADPLSDAILA